MSLIRKHHDVNASRLLGWATLALLPLLIGIMIFEVSVGHSPWLDFFSRFVKLLFPICFFAWLVRDGRDRRQG